MQTEKEIDNIKWFREKDLRIKVAKIDDFSMITVMLENYNICFKMMMFEFINTLSNETKITLKTDRSELNQIVFKADQFNQKTLMRFISDFIIKWNIQITKETVSQSDFITDEVWYSENY